MSQDLNPNSIDQLKLAEPQLKTNWADLKPHVLSKKQRRAKTNRFMAGSAVFACVLGFLAFAIQDTERAPEIARQDPGNEAQVPAVLLEDSLDSETNERSLLQLSEQLSLLQSKIADLEKTKMEMSWAIAKEKLSRTETKPDQLAGFQF